MARRLEDSSLERVKAGPPMWNARAIRLATIPPRAPMVRLALRAGPAASRSWAVQAASSASERLRWSRRAQSRALSLEGPAEVEVGGVEVESDADEDAGVESFVGHVAEASVVEGVGGDLEHEELLGEHVGEFSGWDAETAEGDSDFVDEVAFGVLCGFEAPPAGGGGWGCGVGGEEVVFEGGEVFPGAEVGGHADDGDGGGVGFES